MIVTPPRTFFYRGVLRPRIGHRVQLVDQHTVRPDWDGNGVVTQVGRETVRVSFVYNMTNVRVLTIAT